MGQMTVMTGPERRRRWGDDERQRIMEAAFAPGAVVAKVALEFDVATNLVYKWRRQAIGGVEPGFTPAMVIDSGIVPQPCAPEVGAAVTPIRAELSDGSRVNIEAGAPAGSSPGTPHVDGQTTEKLARAAEGLRPPAAILFGPIIFRSALRLFGRVGDRRTFMTRMAMGTPARREGWAKIVMA